MQDFKVDWSGDKYDALREQVEAFSFPTLVYDDDWSYGCSPSYLRQFLDYWKNDFDLAAAVEDLNRFPQVMVDIDGKAIHAIHVVGEAAGSNPLLLIHGWPGSVYEFWKVIGPLAFPSKFGGDASQAFDLVVPSLPGFGFSSKPAAPIGARTTASLFDQLMRRLGYDRYRVQGGDWGAGVGAWLALDHAPSIAGLHLNYLLVQPDTQPENESERVWKSESEQVQRKLGAYAQLQGSKPGSLAYAMHQNPVAQTAWLLERFHDWSDRRTSGFEEIFSKRQLLTNILIYLMNDAFESAAYFYLGGNVENVRSMPAGRKVAVPTAITVYPDPRIPFPPRSWVERGYNLARWREAPNGGHFAAMEVPEFFVDDIRGWANEGEAASSI